MLQATGVLGLAAGGHVGGDGGEVDVDAEADVDADADADHDHDTEHHGGGVLATVGVGRRPTTIVLQTFLMSFGTVGVVTNSLIWMATGVLSPAELAISAPAAIVGGFGLTALLAKTVGSIVKPPSEAPGKRDLVGLTGVVVSGSVDHEFGEVRIKAQHGEMVQVPCCTLPDEPPIDHHANIVVARYDSEHDRIYVTAAGQGDSVPAAEEGGAHA